MNAKLDFDADALARFCMRHSILRLALFGSTLKGAATPGSDVDLLVEFEPGQEPGLMALAEMEAELSAMLRGRSVDFLRFTSQTVV